MNITIEPMALASDLAQTKLEEVWNHAEHGKIYRIDEAGVSCYVPLAQVVFDTYYDYYMTIIERNRFDGQVFN